MKSFICSICILFFSMQGLSSFAQSPLESVSAPFSYPSSNYIMPNDSSYLYFHSDRVANSDGTFNTTKIVYRYDIDKRLSEELFRTKGVNDTAADLEEVLVSPSSEKIFFSFDGKLYVSNGTKGNVELLGEFGLYYCCDSYGYTRNRVSLLGIIDDVLYFTYATSDNEDISSISNGLPESYFLWQSDGTKEGTKQVPYTEHTDILAVIDNDSIVSDSLLYVTTDKIWLSNKSTMPEIFDERLDSDFSYSTSFLKSSRGNFICNNDQLLRIANDGSIDILGAECDGFFQNNDDIYFYNDEHETNRFELWHTNGTQTDKELLHATEDYDYWVSDHCSIGDKTYVAISSRDDGAIGSVFELSRGALKDVTSVFGLSSIYSVEGCTNEGVVISALDRIEDHSYYYNFMYYNIIEQGVHNIVPGPVRRNNFLSKEPISEPASSAFFVSGTGGINAPFFLQPSYGYLIPTIDMLMD